ncbi:CDP-diacylglycerol--serine O-phosphatidyltransferase [Candidatus Ecksteinia adelgidicola]|nr:CDP-diacylglycerol--serine O-phosphatidyltransferase [Candidatus Ecksteinia adelgidicola]
MTLSKLNNTKHYEYLNKLPKIPQTSTNIDTLYTPLDFRITLLKQIANANYRIYLVVLYLENDNTGKEILHALYHAKKLLPHLDICILVDWHRAQRKRIGDVKDIINYNWYHLIAKKYLNISIPIYGIPVNTQEVLGIFHVKGFIIDNTVIYSGASINNLYFHRYEKYRYDRYQLISNNSLSNIMIEYIQKYLITDNAVQRLDYKCWMKKKDIKNKIRQFRSKLRCINYQTQNQASNNELAVTPLVGLGKNNILNTTIHHLVSSVNKKIILCTPYFNLPKLLTRNITLLLKTGRKVEIIVSDKSANDFYISKNQPFKIISILPYLYEINLRFFVKGLQHYIDNKQLIIRLWKNNNNTFHLKGIWIDEEWQLITGNNLNARAWSLDLENAILIHDPKQELYDQKYKELSCIRMHTIILKNYFELENVQQYHSKIRTLIRRLRFAHIDKLINYIL